MGPRAADKYLASRKPQPRLDWRRRNSHMPSVGQELLDVPLPDMVTKLALGIADAQRALDANSVETAKALADTTIKVVPAITQTIAADGTVTFNSAAAIDMSLLQVGL